jgi:predicted SnoaL-like aldol condensation-catalyzing enzyme|tara:strand:- start:64 stop:339 length:276 start_codon:yes stop_codon:yes gene_type:complete
MIKHPSDTYGDKRSPILALFQKMLLTKPEDDPFLRSIKDGAFIFTYVHAQMKNRRVVMKEFKSKSADMMMVVRLVFADAFCVVVVVVSLWV